jgi:two-component system KDP operon response regulator KdpE
VLTEAVILVIDDEPTLAHVLQASLTARGYEVHVAATGKRGLQLASTIEPDLVILDLGLPDIDGIEVCRQLRRWSTSPIVVLTVENDEAKKIQALDDGADDYVTKPFSMPELYARIRVALRHRRLLDDLEPESLIVVGDVQIDATGHRVTIDGEPTRFTAKQFTLLTLLARNAGRVLTYGTLLARLWPNDKTNRVEPLRVHINQLRRKLDSGPIRPVIETEPGVGYRLVIPAHGPAC